jgi:hypothetical protein
MTRHLASVPEGTDTTATMKWLRAVLIVVTFTWSRDSSIATAAIGW